jgi:hypothetical protein
MQSEKLEYHDIDFEAARRARMRALQHGMGASASLALAGAYLHYGQHLYALVAFAFVSAFSVWTYAHSLKCAFELCARQLPAREALRWCGGVLKILFPSRAHYIPPSQGRR